MKNFLDRNQIENHYAVILAGGDGTRLKNLTRVISGDERPKQFCQIMNDETLLEKTQERVALKILPENTFYSLTQKHERFYQPILADVDRNQLIVQPENKGTAPAILLSLLKLPPEAVVTFVPSDHYFSDDAEFMNHVETAIRSAKRNSQSIVLLGVEPEKAETSYGWIEPVESIFGNLSRTVSQVKRFWEKPDAAAAEELLMKGCLWNSFVMVGKVQTFLDIIKNKLPELYRMFQAAKPTLGTASESATVRSIYAWINETNFSSEVLEKCADEIFVLRVSDVRWSDWGEPHRVLGTLESLGVEPQWKFALAA